VVFGNLPAAGLGAAARVRLGQAAVEVVERVVTVPAPTMKTPAHGAWPGLLRELAAQLDTGRIYDRERPELAVAIQGLLAAWTRSR